MQTLSYILTGLELLQGLLKMMGYKVHGGKDLIDGSFLALGGLSRIVKSL